MIDKNVFMVLKYSLLTGRVRLPDGRRDARRIADSSSTNAVSDDFPVLHGMDCASFTLQPAMIEWYERGVNDA
jgi:hypothetical protein